MALEPFPKSAPSFFLPIPMIPKLVQELKESEDLDTRSFGTTLSKNLTELESGGERQKIANEISVYQSATFTPLWANQSRSFLADLHLKSSLNYGVDKEKIKEVYKDIVLSDDTTNAMQNVQAVLSEKEAERRKKIQDLATLHNLEYLPDISNANPFKEGTPEYEEFNQLDIEHNLTGRYENSLFGLGEEGKKLIEESLKKAQKALTTESVENPFTDTKIDAFEATQNYFDLFGDKANWNSWDKQTTFGILLARSSQLSTTHKSIRTFSGPAYDYLESVRAAEKVGKALETDASFKSYVENMKAVLTQISDITQNLQPILETEGSGTIFGTQRSDKTPIKTSKSANEVKSEAVRGALKTLSEEVLALRASAKANANMKSKADEIEKLISLYDTAAGESYQLNKEIESSKTHALRFAKQWADVVGKNLPTPYLYVSFSSFIEAAPEALKQVDLANWEGKLDSELAKKVTADSGGLMEKLVTDSLDYIKEAFIRKQTQIFENGVLKSKVNLDALDISKVSGIDRTNITLNTAYGQSLKMEDLLALIGKGAGLEQKFNNAVIVKNTLMDMIQAASGIGYKGSASKLEANIRKLKPSEVPDGYAGDISKLVASTIHPNADWTGAIPKETEKGTEGTQVEVGQVKGKPLEMIFESKKAAEGYFKQLLDLNDALDALLQPLDKGGHKTMTATGPEDTEYRLLVNNAGQLGLKGLIQEGSDEYAVSVDTFLKAKDVQNQRWKAISDYIMIEGGIAIALSTLQVVVSNMQRKGEKEAEIKKYDEEKEEFKQEQIQEIREKNKIEAEQDAQLKRMEKESKKEHDRIAALEKKQAEESRASEKQKEAQSRQRTIQQSQADQAKQKK